MTERTQRLSRRSFLFTVGAGGAAAIAAKNVPTLQAPEKSKRASRGYHATAHVNHYYRTAKV